MDYYLILIHRMLSQEDDPQVMLSKEGIISEEELQEYIKLALEGKYFDTNQPLKLKALCHWNGIVWVEIPIKDQLLD